MNSDFQTLPTVVRLNPKDNLQIIRADITRDLKLAIDLLNIDKTTIQDVTFSVIYKDAYDNFLFNGSEFFYYSKNLNIQPNTVYYVEPFEIDERFKEARSISIFIKSFTLSDGKAIEYNNIQEKKFILPIITDKKQEKIKNILGTEILTYGENLIDGWRCVCGATNEKDSQECRNCGRNKNFVLNNLTEPLINIKLLNTISDSMDFDDNEKKEMLTSNLTQTQLTKVAPEAEELEEKRVNQNEIVLIKKDSKFKYITKILEYFLIAVFVIFLSVLLFKFAIGIRNKYKLDNARSYAVAGEYEKALSIYESLEDSKHNVLSDIENTKKLLKSKEAFENGNQFILKSDYLNAVKSFKEVLPEDTIHFSSSQDKISDLEDIILDKARDKMNDGNKKEALQIIDDYLKVVPESANATSLRDMISRNVAESTTLEQKLNASLEEGFETDKSRAEITKKAENLLNTYQKVRASKANLRKSPSIEADIITVLPTDSDLYVKETKIEGQERIWCKVEAKDSNTQKIYHGWISNKTMEVGTDL